MNEEINRKREKLTDEEKKLRRDKKRVREIRRELGEYYAILNLHQIYDIEGDDDKSIKDVNINYANKKIAELEAQL